MGAWAMERLTEDQVRAELVRFVQGHGACAGCYVDVATDDTSIDEITVSCQTHPRAGVVVAVHRSMASVWLREADGTVYAAAEAPDGDGLVEVHIKPAGFVPTAATPWPLIAACVGQ